MIRKPPAACPYCDKSNFLRGLAHQARFERQWKCGGCGSRLRFCAGTRRDYYRFVVLPLGILFMLWALAVRDGVEPFRVLGATVLVYMAATAGFLYRKGNVEPAMLPPGPASKREWNGKNEI